MTYEPQLNASNLLVDLKAKGEVFKIQTLNGKPAHRIVHKVCDL